MTINLKSGLIILATTIVVCVLLPLQASFAQVIIDEQFDGNAVDTSIFTFDDGNTIFGRVRLNSGAPPVQNGTLRLRLQSFNPIDTGNLFLADEIRTRRTFTPTENFGFSFETRARFVDDASNPLNRGVIGGIFLFGLDANFPNPNERDEIDFELLSNFPQDTISTNIFNDDGFDSSGDFVISDFPGLDLTQFNDYRIEIQIDSTRFYVNDQLVREENTGLALEPQDFRLNINAQGPEFGAAFSPLIQPTANPANNEIVIMEVDSLVITQLPAGDAPVGNLVLADFTTSSTAVAFERFEGAGTLSNDGFQVTLAETDDTNFGVVSEFNDNLVTKGFIVNADTQLLVEAIIGPSNDTDLVVAVREASGEFFSVMVPASDLADDGRAIVNLSDFFFNDGGPDGVLNGVITEVSFQSPFGSGNAVDFTIQRISVLSDVVILGDFDRDGNVDADDIDFYKNQIDLTVADAAFNPDLDLDLNNVIDLDDHALHIETLVQTSTEFVGTSIGDVNLDGVVDVLGDAFILIANLGSSAPVGYAGGDLNADCIVDVLSDAFVLIANLGNSNSP